MVTFILWVAVIGTGLCALVFLTLFTLIFAAVFNYIREKASVYSLPPPDRAAERMYDQQYFDRAVSKD